MKICIVGRAINKKGGVSRYNAELAEQLCKEHEVHLLVAWYENKYKNNFIIHPYSIPKNPYVLQISSSFIKVSTLARKLDEKFGFDIIHTSEAEGLYQDVITAQSCIRGAFEMLKKNNIVYDFLRRIRPFTLFGLTVERMVYSHHKYEKIIAVSEGVKREIMKYYNIPEDEIAVIPNGVNIEEFKPDNESRKRVRGKYGIGDDEIVLMFSGYEFKRKGLRYIIEALPLIKRDVKLLVVGKDNQKPYEKLALDAGVSDNMIFAGASSNIREYYAASDMFVFPTAYEAFSLATLEAVASGLPILATNVNGTEELIKNGYNGFFIKRDPLDISEKINQIIDDEKLRKDMSINARKSAEKYTWDKVAEKTLEVYEEVAKG